jgi:regulator of ribonuclease activity B
MKPTTLLALIALVFAANTYAMDKSKNFERNVKVVQALKEAGSDFEKLHSIEHHLYCYTETDLNLVISLGKKSGYSVANEDKLKDDKGFFWALDLVKKSTPDIASVEKQSIEIERIAEKANADYDGWGTEVEK